MNVLRFQSQGWCRYVRGRWGFPYLEIRKCLVFLVSKIYQIATPCFQEDIDLISKRFKISLDVSSGLFGVRLFQKKQSLVVSIFENY